MPEPVRKTPTWRKVAYGVIVVSILSLTGTLLHACSNVVTLGGAL